MPSTDKNKLPFAFGKKNYQLMLVGIGVIVLGLLIMNADDSQHGFGFLALKLAPVVIMTGFIIEFFAIFHKEK
jgi:hypothetical protein